MWEWGHTGVLVCSVWLVIPSTGLHLILSGLVPPECKSSYIYVYCIDPSIPYHSNSNSVVLLEFVRFGTMTCLYKYTDKYQFL